MKVLFLCTANSVRSQMAEALLRRMAGDRVEVWSAGVAPAGIHPMTVRVLEEEGIDLSDQRSKSVDEIPLRGMDWIITLCGHARDVCPPLPPGVRYEHWPIDDPVGLIGTLEQKLSGFRQTRETIRGYVAGFLERIRNGS